MPWAFLAVIATISGITAIAVILGTDADGSKAFISTAADQKSLMAFAYNGLIIAGLFGAIAVAREYGHDTVVPTFLIEPRRHRAVLAQFAALMLSGAFLGFVGTALSMGTVAIALTATDYSFMLSVGDTTQLLAASSFAAAIGALLGAGIGTLVRNTGGAVAALVLVLLIAPPLVVQLVSDAISWVPGYLANVASGVIGFDDVGMAAALIAMAAWAALPAMIGLFVARRRDVV
jgi:ABC-type transport system involved in multi-copper enzyme maturation permease subunit